MSTRKSSKPSLRVQPRFPRDRLGTQAQRAFRKWVATLTPKQKRKLFGAPR